MCACGRGEPGWKPDPGVCPNDDASGPAGGHCACCHEPDADERRPVTADVQRVVQDWLERPGATASELATTVQRLIADAEKRAAAAGADSIADTVLALADDFLVAFPPADGHMDDAVDVDEAYDWLVAQAVAIRAAALDPAGAASGETT